MYVHASMHVRICFPILLVSTSVCSPHVPPICWVMYHQQLYLHVIGFCASSYCTQLHGQTQMLQVEWKHRAESDIRAVPRSPLGKTRLEPEIYTRTHAHQHNMYNIHKPFPFPKAPSGVISVQSQCAQKASEWDLLAGAYVVRKGPRQRSFSLSSDERHGPSASARSYCLKHVYLELSWTPSGHHSNRFICFFICGHFISMEHTFVKSCKHAITEQGIRLEAAKKSPSMKISWI